MIAKGGGFVANVSIILNRYQDLIVSSVKVPKLLTSIGSAIRKLKPEITHPTYLA